MGESEHRCHQMKNHRPSVLLVHGAWHNSATWQKMTPLLLAAGFDARTLDLPGAGVYARSPRSYREQPFDPKAFATEPSPSANITQSERTAAVVSLIEQLGGNVVLVGHSMGGLTISAVAEAPALRRPRFGGGIANQSCER